MRQASIEEIIPIIRNGYEPRQGSVSVNATRAVHRWRARSLRGATVTDIQYRRTNGGKPVKNLKVHSITMGEPEVN